MYIRFLLLFIPLTYSLFASHTLQDITTKKEKTVVTENPENDVHIAYEKYLNWYTDNISKNQLSSEKRKRIEILMKALESALAVDNQKSHTEARQELWEQMTKLQAEATEFASQMDLPRPPSLLAIAPTSAKPLMVRPPKRGRSPESSDQGEELVIASTPGNEPPSNASRKAPPEGDEYEQ